MKRALIAAGALAGLLVVAFLVLRTPDVPTDDLKARYASASSQFLEIAPGFTVHLRDEGARDAPALMLVHGSNASLHTWERWVRALGATHRVITLDLQGHGLTGPHPDRCYTRACMVETVEAVRRLLGVEQLAIGGNSMGGAVAIAYALAYPDRTRALILVDAAGAQVNADRVAPIGFRIARMPVLRDLAEHVTPRSMIERSLDASVSVKSVAGAADVDRYWELLRHPGNRRATLDRFGTASPPITKADLATLGRMPTLILWGEEDRLFPPAHAIWFQAALPHARTIVYPGVGHLPQEEAPDRSATDVAAFLAAHGAASEGAPRA